MHSNLSQFKKANKFFFGAGVLNRGWIYPLGYIFPILSVNLMMRKLQYFVFFLQR